MIKKLEAEGGVTDAAKSAMPFVELAKAMTELNPTKLIEQFASTLGGVPVAGLDIDAFLEANRKNVEAVGAANKRMLENAEAVMVRQGEILRQTMEETVAAIKRLSSAETPQGIAAQQGELIRQMLLRTLENMREMAELTAKSSADAFESANERIGDHMEDIRAMLRRMERHP